MREPARTEPDGQLPAHGMSLAQVQVSRGLDPGRDPVVFAWRAMMPSTKRRAYPRHAADPCHRIDIRRSSRHLVVRQDDQLVAETHVPLVLDESAVAEPATSAEARA